MEVGTKCKDFVSYTNANQKTFTKEEALASSTTSGQNDLTSCLALISLVIFIPVLVQWTHE